MDRGSPTKRRKLSNGAVDAANLRRRRAAFLDSLSRPVSPPGQMPGLDLLTTKDNSPKHNPPNSASRLRSTPQTSEINGPSDQNAAGRQDLKNSNIIKPSTSHTTVSSPYQLSRIQDLPSTDNVDTVNLHDVLGDPLIKEAWIFNFCFDVDWLMRHFDPDVRDLVQVKIVHGSWRNEDGNKIGIDDACHRRTNVKAIQAYLPDAFGTHHSKIFILFRQDDLAQVIIHTANMLEKDWTNMTQAIWRSPLLPLLQIPKAKKADDGGCGRQFKDDLCRYFKAYGNKLRPLIQQIQLHDFREVKAALVASVPSKFKSSATDDEVWGYEMLRRKLRDTGIVTRTKTEEPYFVFQVSSIASLPMKWLEGTLYSACGASKESTAIIFPTAPDVAQSLDGYAAGGSIHTKAQSDAHLKQISTLRPQLHRWAKGVNKKSEAGRHLAAPHIKTYIRFSSKPSAHLPAPDIQWALVTSANLSTQAWGTIPKLAKGEKDHRNASIHIQSFEIGVLTWPVMFADDGHASDSMQKGIYRMVPTFRTDSPEKVDIANDHVIGFRMPYDLPLTPYGAEELPWSPQSAYDEPDSHGRLWQPF